VASFLDRYPKITIDERTLADLAATRPARRYDPSLPRGVVLAPAIRDLGTDVYHRRQEEYRLLRKSLLYWDRIVWPTVADFADVEREMLTTGIKPVPKGLQALEDEGIVINLPIINHRLDDSQPYDPLPAWQWHQRVYLNLVFDEPHSWAIAASGEEHISPDRKSPQTRVMLCRLVDALPSPALDVPLQEILEFKQRRRDELLSLRSRLDQLYTELIASPDIPHREATIFRTLNSSIDNIWKSIDNKRHFVRDSISALLAVPWDAMAGAGGVVTLAEPYNIPVRAGAAVGAAHGVLRLAWQMATRPKADPGAFAYLYNAARNDAIRR
jgi:hypothetical protein